MATYEFYCKHCEVTGEENRRVRDRNNVYTCKSCGNVCQRQIGLSNFHLKGVGWARDGYKNKQSVPPGYGGKR